MLTVLFKVFAEARDYAKALAPKLGESVAITKCTTGWKVEVPRLDKDGFDKNGYNLEGFNVNGIDKYGYDKEGFNGAGYNKDMYDREGYYLGKYKLVNGRWMDKKGEQVDTEKLNGKYAPVSVGRNRKVYNTPTATFSRIDGDNNVD